MKKRLLFAVSVPLAIGAIYFVAIPQVLDGQFKKELAPCLTTLPEKVVAAAGTFDSDPFVKNPVTESSAATAAQKVEAYQSLTRRYQDEIKIAREKIEEAEKTINSYTPPTPRSLPLLKSKTTDKQRAARCQEYVAHSRSYLTEHKAVVAWFEKNYDDSRALQSKYGALLSAVQQRDANRFIRVAEDLTVLQERLLKDHATAKPPESVAAFDQFALEQEKQMLEIARQNVVALRRGDSTGSDMLAAQRARIADQLNVQYVKFLPALHTKSKLSQFISKEKELRAGLASS